MLELGILLLGLLLLFALGQWFFEVLCYWLGYGVLKIITFGRHPLSLHSEEAISTQNNQIGLFGLLLLVLFFAGPAAMILWVT